MKTANKIKAIIISASVAMCACAKQDREVTISQQEANIDSYIASMQDNYPVTRNNGSNRITLNEDSIAVNAPVIEKGDSVYMNYAGYIFNNRKGDLFDTNIMSTALEEGFQLTEATYQVKGIVAGDPDIIQGLNKGLEGAREGESCEILFSAKYGYYNSFVYNIPKMSALLYEIEIVKVVKR